MCQLWVDCKKCDRKNNSSVDCAEAGKKTVQALRFGMRSELTRKGEDFCLPVVAPAELPGINYQVKPDRFVFLSAKSVKYTINITNQLEDKFKLNSIKNELHDDCVQLYNVRISIIFRALEAKL